MAQSSVQSNNKAVLFRGRAEKEIMPSVSQAQNRFMHAVAEGDVKGVAPSVGKKFVKADAGRKIKKLPKRVKRKARKFYGRGMISDKAMKAHFGEA